MRSEEVKEMIMNVKFDNEEIMNRRGAGRSGGGSLNPITEDFPAGIQEFEALYLTDPFWFPKGKKVCRYCLIGCRYEEDFKRFSCRFTGEWLLEPFKERGHFCPLKEKKNGEK